MTLLRFWTTAKRPTSSSTSLVVVALVVVLATVLVAVLVVVLVVVLVSSSTSSTSSSTSGSTSSSTVELLPVGHTSGSLGSSNSSRRFLELSRTRSRSPETLEIP